MVATMSKKMSMFGYLLRNYHYYFDSQSIVTFFLIFHPEQKKLIFFTKKVHIQYFSLTLRPLKQDSIILPIGKH